MKAVMEFRRYSRPILVQWRQRQRPLTKPEYIAEDVRTLRSFLHNCSRPVNVMHEREINMDPVEKKAPASLFSHAPSPLTSADY